MSETLISTPAEQAEVSNEAFSSEHGWIVQCLSLATLVLLTYMHVLPTLT